MPEKKGSIKTLQDVPASTWKTLSEKKIFFGHRSVGNNIIAGIRDLMKEDPQIKLRIVETSKPSDFNTPIFAHVPVGKNTDPQSKINAFVSIMEKGIGDKVDIAFFKFCFVDIVHETDIEKVFGDYKDAMIRLNAKYPEAVFIHVTVPLIKRKKTTFKSWIKGLTGMKIGFFDNSHNVARNEFNRLIKEQYKEKEPVFDLAKVESTFPDGTRETFTRHGKTYYSVVPDYTSDAGHLNEVGRKRVAEQLVLLLASLSEQGSTIGHQP